jgi:fused signal recognition particle receptor
MPSYLYIALIAVVVTLFLIYSLRQRKSPQALPKPLAAEPPSKSIDQNKEPIQKVQPWSLGLKKSREPFLARFKDAIQTMGGGTPWNESHPLWEKLEELLLVSDLGPKLCDHLLNSLKKNFPSEPTEVQLKLALKNQMLALLQSTPVNLPEPQKPCVTLLIGVNGAGKTTSAGKLAFQAKQKGKAVLLGAADTFRAAAVEQLQTWAERIGVECVVPAQGANPAAVAFDAVDAAIARGVDEVIIDTAGRLHTKDNLMEELRKIARVVDKKIPGAPHRVYLVLDASLGQNALPQAREFTAAIKTSGVILTKLDGSAKGGAAFAVTTELGIPILYVGLGETAEDLRPFSPEDFVQHLLQV